MSLQDLMNEIERSWTFDKQNYPDLPTGRDKACQRSLFAIRHILLHQQKALGALAEILEKADHITVPEHGLPCETTQATGDIIIKQIINALQLANIYGFSGHGLKKLVIEHLNRMNA